jgi:hypothetical protein
LAAVTVAAVTVAADAVKEGAVVGKTMMTAIPDRARGVRFQAVAISIEGEF